MANFPLWVYGLALYLVGCFPAYIYFYKSFRKERNETIVNLLIVTVIWPIVLIIHFIVFLREYPPKKAISYSAMRGSRQKTIQGKSTQKAISYSAMRGSRQKTIQGKSTNITDAGVSGAERGMDAHVARTNLDDVMMRNLFDDLTAIDFDPRQFPNVFLLVERSLLGKLLEAFELKERNIDYFNDGSGEIQIPGTKTLQVKSDRTNSIPMSEERSVVTDEKYLSCRLFFVRTKNNDVYCFGTEESGEMLTEPKLHRFIYSAVRSVETR